MQKDGYWVIRTYKAGAVGEKTKFWVPGKRPDKNISRRQRDAIRKREQNEYSAVKRLARILNMYFSSGDLMLGIDYADKGIRKLEKQIVDKGINIDELDETQKLEAMYLAADHELTNCLRRATRRAKKDGVILKAALTTSDMDGETGESVRVHHHLVINKEAKEYFVAAWGDLGGVTWDPMWSDQEDRTDIAAYMLRQVRHVPDSKKFRTTRNLTPPVPKDRIVNSDAELQVPRGGKLLFRREFSRNDSAQYIRYVLPKYVKTNELSPDEQTE
jgi:hypothetical protein